MAEPIFRVKDSLYYQDFQLVSTLLSNISLRAGPLYDLKVLQNGTMV